MSEGTEITSADMLNSMYEMDQYFKRNCNYFDSNIDFEKEYIKEKQKIFAEYERLKYLEMWKKVKMEFPFVNKM